MKRKYTSFVKGKSQIINNFKIMSDVAHDHCKLDTTIYMIHEEFITEIHIM
jgi:hypothetical protein